MARPVKRKPKWVPAPPAPTTPVLFTSEYDWIELSASVTKEEFIAEMNRMGKDGWRAFHITDHGGMTRIWLVRLHD